MGQVWHATLLSLDTSCAVKFIDGEFAAQAEPQARFEREAKAAAQLRSPHVVQILEHGIEEGRPYIAMELLEGEDLRKRLKREGRLSPPEVLTIVTQVSRALMKAHAGGIVHRDLKPDNIFIARDDDREIVKVLDFGMAKSLAGGGFTRAGAMIGTPYYVSPEQAQGSKGVDHRSDLWSLAVICFQCLLGRRPFSSQSLGELLLQIMVHEPPVPSQVESDVPTGFDAWWQRAAARDPAQRFQSARELTEHLAVALGLDEDTSRHPRRRSMRAERNEPNADDTQPAPPGMQTGTSVMKLVSMPGSKIQSFERVAPSSSARPRATTAPLAAQPAQTDAWDSRTRIVPPPSPTRQTPPHVAPAYVAHTPANVAPAYVAHTPANVAPAYVAHTPPNVAPAVGSGASSGPTSTNPSSGGGGGTPNNAQQVAAPKKSELYGAMGVVIACMALIFCGLVIASYVLGK